MVARVNQLRPDVVVVDSDLVRDGLAAITVLHQRFPTIPSVVMTGDADPNFWCKAFGAGASAFVFKAEVTDKLIAVVRSLVVWDLLNEIRTLDTVPTATGDTRRRAVGSTGCCGR